VIIHAATLPVDAFMFSGGIGLPEILLVLAIVLIIFGPKRLPALGRSLGSGMRNFKESVTGNHKDDDDDEDEKPELTAAQADAVKDSAASKDEVVSERRG
jgi:sec-independent protein translocase protein TatA